VAGKRMTAQEHEAEAEFLLERVRQDKDLNPVSQMVLLAEAQVHATLSLKHWLTR
jgi:hypothetical protein